MHLSKLDCNKPRVNINNLVRMQEKKQLFLLNQRGFTEFHLALILFIIHKVIVLVCAFAIELPCSTIVSG